MAARVLLGAVLYGNDELDRRFGATQQVYRPSPVERDELLISEDDADRRRYAVIGAVVETTDTVRQSASTAFNLADRAFQNLSRFFRPVTGSRLAFPLNRRIDRFAARGDAIVRHWVDTGRAEELLSRKIAEQTAVQSIEGTLDYLAHSPELDQLTREQSIDLVDELVGEPQVGSSGTRVYFIRWIRGIFFRLPKDFDDSKK
jgi:hypothetical protein